MWQRGNSTRRRSRRSGGRLGRSSATSDPAGGLVWTLDQDAFFELCADVDGAGPDAELVAEAFAVQLSAQQVDELERRCGGELTGLVDAVLPEVAVEDGPEVVIDAVARRLAGQGITLRFRGVPHVLPEHSRTGTPPPPPRG